MSIGTLAIDSPEYKKAYNRGWAAGRKFSEGATARADARNEPHAWYHGYNDADLGRAKWTSAVPSPVPIGG